MTMPAPDAAPAATRNPTAMILGVVGAVLVVAGALLDWISDVPDTAGLDAPVAVFWSTDLSADASFFTSAGFVLIVIAAITLIGAGASRGGVVLLGGVLGVLAFALVVITLLRVEEVELGIGDFALGLWAILVGGVVTIAAGLMGRRATA